MASQMIATVVNSLPMRTEPIADSDLLPVVSYDVYAQRTAKSNETRGYLVPGYLSA